MSNADLWELEQESPEWLPAIINRLLAVGVPPTAIANAFNIDPQPIKDILNTINITRYGTAELAEAMHGLIWKAFADANAIIESAPIDKRMRFDMALLARASSIVGGQEPEGMAKLQNDLAALAMETREVASTGATSIYETNPVDAPIDDPEKGLAG